MTECFMVTDEGRRELVPTNPRIPYQGVPRHTPQRTLHGITCGVHHRRPQSRCSGRSSRARPNTFACVQTRREEKDGPHVCVASIEGLEPNVGDHIQRNVDERTQGYLY